MDQDQAYSDTYSSSESRAAQVPGPAPGPTSGPAQSPARLRAALLRHTPFISIFLLALFILTININTPWRTSHEDNGFVFTMSAINHIRYGLGFTKGQDYFDTGKIIATSQGFQLQGVPVSQTFTYLRFGPSQPVLYGHHPPALGLTIAAAFLTFGYHYWVARAVPLAYTLLALLLLYLLTNLLFGRITATVASLLFITFPVIAYYGRDVAHEAPTLAWSLGMALCYVMWRREGRARWLAGIAMCVALGAAYGWPMIYFAWILLGVDTLATRRVSWRLAASTALVATAMFALLVAQIAWVTQGFSVLKGEFLFRSGSVGGFSALGWLIQIVKHNTLDFGFWGSLALIPALVYIATRIRREGWSMRARIVLYFGAAGVAHILIFREGAYVHDYWQFYLAPFYALAIAWGASALACRLWPGAPARQALALGVAGFSGLLIAFFTVTLRLYYFTGGGIYNPANTGNVVTIFQTVAQGLSTLGR